MKRFTVAAPGGPIGGVVVGAGPVVVLIAGLGATHRLWGELPLVMARRCRVVAIDNRGVGDSRDGEPFTLEGMARDLLAALDDLGIDGFRLLGASLGGLIALHTALAAPSRAEALVVASSAARLTAHGRRSMEMLRDLLRHLPPTRMGAALMTLAFAPAFHGRFAGFVRDTAALYGPEPADVPGALAQAEHLLGGWDLRPALAALPCPTLVVAGDRDPIVAREDTAEIAAALPRAELVRIAEAAHSVLAEGGGALLDRILDFLTAPTPTLA